MAGYTFVLATCVGYVPIPTVRACKTACCNEALIQALQKIPMILVLASEAPSGRARILKANRLAFTEDA